jgi:Tfp pilus assembly protein PilO
MEDLIDKYKNLELSKRLLIVFFFAIAYPVLTYSEEIEILEEELEGAILSQQSAKAKVRKAEKAVKKLTILEQDIDLINKELVAARKYLPEAIEFDEILAAFGSYEKDFSVRMVKFMPGVGRKVSEKASYQEVPLNLELQAKFSQVMLFLDKVVHRRDLVHIRLLEFVPAEPERNRNAQATDDPDKQEGVVRAKVELVFYRKDV